MTRAHLPALVGAAVCIVLGLALSLTPLAILGVMVGVVASFLMALRQGKELRSQDLTEELSPDSRTLLRPLRRMHQEMQDLAQRNPDGVSPFLAQEAIDEGRRLMEQSAAALLLRDRLVRERRGAYDAEKSVADLDARLSSATSEEERQSLQGALDARGQELQHYGKLDEAIARIESSVRQAEATMAELKARMASSAAGTLATKNDDSLREALGRTRAISESLNEAQELGQQI